MAFDNLLLEHDGPVAILTINRPKVNALNSALMDELRRAVLELEADDRVRVVIVTGAGDKAFVAGADINELATLSPLQGKDHTSRGQHVLDLIEHMGKPVIAAVNGFALGGGCELAMACTLRIAADTATFGQPEVNLGLIPGYGGTQRLPRLIGRTRAMDLLLTGRHLTAAEALQLGLVNRVVPAADLMTQAKTIAHDLATKAPIAMRCIIEAVNRGLQGTLAEGQFVEATLFGVVASTDDMREGTRAFLEKRSPQWKGR